MNCEKFADMLDNYACLSEDELQELEAHSQLCDSCADELEFMRSILASAKSLPPIEPPSDFLDSVNARLDAELDAETPIKRFMRRSKPYISRYGAIAACVAVAAAVGTNAGVLMTRMNNSGDGVISEQKTASGSNEADTKLGDTFAFPEETAAADIPLMSGVGASDFSELSNTAAQTPEPAQPPAAKSDTVKQSAANAVTAAPSTSKVSVSSNTGRTPASSKAPAAAPQPLASESNNTAAATAVPAQTAEQTITETPSAPSVTNTVNTAQVQTPQPKASEADDEPSYEIAVQTIESSGGYAAAYATDAPAGNNEADLEIDAELSDYTIAYLNMDQASTYASLSSTISVKAKDIARVTELVDVFVNGVYGNYYMITSQDMDGLLGQFDREGIWYSANIMESGDKISFKLITMQMD